MGTILLHIDSIESSIEFRETSKRLCGHTKTPTNQMKSKKSPRQVPEVKNHAILSSYGSGRRFWCVPAKQQSIIEIYRSVKRQLSNLGVGVGEATLELKIRVTFSSFCTRIAKESEPNEENKRSMLRALYGSRRDTVTERDTVGGLQ